jgi:hypothetical protein
VNLLTLSIMPASALISSGDFVRHGGRKRLFSTLEHAAQPIYGVHSALPRVHVILLLSGFGGRIDAHWLMQDAVIWTGLCES